MKILRTRLRDVRLAPQGLMRRVSEQSVMGMPCRTLVTVKELSSKEQVSQPSVLGLLLMLRLALPSFPAVLVLIVLSVHGRGISANPFLA